MAFDYSHENISVRVNGLATGTFFAIANITTCMYSAILLSVVGLSVVADTCAMITVPSTIGYFPSEMTTSASNEENESSYDVDGFRAAMQALGATTVKRMGTARDLASVRNTFFPSFLSYAFPLFILRSELGS